MTVQSWSDQDRTDPLPPPLWLLLIGGAVVGVLLAGLYVAGMHVVCWANDPGPRYCTEVES